MPGSAVCGDWAGPPVQQSGTSCGVGQVVSGPIIHSAGEDAPQRPSTVTSNGVTGYPAKWVGSGGLTCYTCEDDTCAPCGWLPTTDCPSGYISVSAGQCGGTSCYKCEVDPNSCAGQGYSATDVPGGNCTPVQVGDLSCYSCVGLAATCASHGEFESCPPPNSPQLTKATNQPHVDKNGQIYYCVTCDYPDPVAASFAPVGPMGSMAFTG